MASKTGAQAKQLKKDGKNSCSKARQIEGSNHKTKKQSSTFYNQLLIK